MAECKNCKGEGLVMVAPGLPVRANKRDIIGICQSCNGTGSTKTIKESDVIKDCLELLKLNQIPHWRNGVHHGLFRGFKEKPGKERIVKTGVAGLSDWSFFLPDGSGRTVYMEVKKPSGKQSQDQIDFEATCKRFGVEYIVVRSWVDLAEYLEAYGCLKVGLE